jgi:hypothetical protein
MLTGGSHGAAIREGVIVKYVHVTMMWDSVFGCFKHIWKGTHICVSTDYAVFQWKL